MSVCECVDCEYLPGGHVYKYSIDESSSVRGEKLTNTSCSSVFFHLALSNHSRVFLFAIFICLFNSIRDLCFYCCCCCCVQCLCVFTLERPLSVLFVSIPRKRQTVDRLSVLLFSQIRVYRSVYISNLEYCIFVYIISAHTDTHMATIREKSCCYVLDLVSFLANTKQ